MITDRLAIGAVAGAHGVRGQFKVKPFTEASRDIASYGPVLAGDRQLTLVVKGVASNGMVIVAAAEITDRDAAQALRGTELTGARQPSGTGGRRGLPCRPDRACRRDTGWRLAWQAGGAA